MSETERIWDLLQRSFEGGEAWRCPSLRDLMGDVSAEQAAARPIAGAPSVWELVLLHGTIDHAVYHAGQMEMLMLAQGVRVSASPMAIRDFTRARP
jgi:hypothetical protein